MNLYIDYISASPISSAPDEGLDLRLLHLCRLRACTRSTQQIRHEKLESKPDFNEEIGQVDSIPNCLKVGFHSSLTLIWVHVARGTTRK